MDIAERKLADPEWEKRTRELTPIEVDQIAEVIHEANRMYRSTWEDAGPRWIDAPNEVKDSLREGIRRVLGGGKGERIFHGHELEEENHNAWMERKLRAGWRYGERADFEAKTHPCLLPYASLPCWQRRKDALFRAIAIALDPRRDV